MKGHHRSLKQLNPIQMVARASLNDQRLQRSCLKVQLRSNAEVTLQLGYGNC